MSKHRYTIEKLAGGQPRAYGPTINHTRVTMEVMEDWRGETEWKPSPITSEDFVKHLFRGLQCGFTDFDYSKSAKTMDDHFKTRLDWLKLVAPGVWEFHTSSEYTG